jgi:ABC-type Mn2+/Zn2+ transport system ATPase subunit
MEIHFKGKYKSITDFDWFEIPNFVVITGPNGTGKSQLLDLIYNTLINKRGTTERVSMVGQTIKKDEVIYLKGEWQLVNTANINLSTIQRERDQHYNNFKNENNYRNQGGIEGQIKIYAAYEEVLSKIGKSPNQITKEEFDEYFPEILIEQESQLSQKIGEIFYNYRLSEIELQAKNKPKEEIQKEIGEKPWVVLRDIIKESKLPFDINDPSTNGIRDGFKLVLTHQVLKEPIDFNDLSSGERVLIALVFYLYNSQEKKTFPKLLLLDEPDAHLHPSMSQQFLNVIKNVLVDKFGVQVIMTTHSPSTVILAPDESIYEMSRLVPRIRKSPSRNHSVSLLTAGLVYVGEGTKYFLVEDNDDVKFYSYVYDQLRSENLIDADIPLVFIPASTKDNSGGKDVVQNWVNKLQESGMVNILQGLIDADSGNVVSKGVYKIDRYSIENYLADPILVYATLIDKEKHPIIEGLRLTIGEEYKLKSLSSETLQLVADTMINAIEPKLKDYFSDFDQLKETERVQITFTNGVVLLYPKWLISRRGKTIINEVYNQIFSSTLINFSTLFKALRKLNIFPKDLVDKLNEIKTAV